MNPHQIIPVSGITRTLPAETQTLKIKIGVRRFYGEASFQVKATRINSDSEVSQTFTISGKSEAPFQKEYTLQLPSAGVWDVFINRVDTFGENALYWLEN